MLFRHFSPHTLPSFFFPPLQKEPFLFPFDARAWVKVSGWLKSCLLAGGQGSGRDLDAGDSRRAPPMARGSGAPGAPCRACRRAFRRDITQPGLGPRWPAQVAQVVTHLLGELHLLLQEAVLQEPTELGVSVCRSQGMQIQEGLVQALLQGRGGLHGIHAGAPLVREQFLPFLGHDAATPRLLHLHEKLDASLPALLLSHLPKEAAHALQSHLLAFEGEAQSEVSG